MPHILAAIDLGSNSFHMIVGRQEAGQIIIIDKLREMVRLASGLDDQNRINSKVMQQALDCLARFGERIRHLHADVVRIVGTNTLRKAKNSREFMQQAEALLGHPIEIISGIEEARLIYSGVSHNVDTDNGHRLVTDIGGGSTEIIIGERFKPLLMESLHMGCVSMSRLFFADGKITLKRIKKAHMHAMMKLEPYRKSYQALGWQDSIGASGTARSIEKISIAQGWTDNGISTASLDNIIDHFLHAGQIDAIELQGLKDERKAVIVGGVIVMRAIFLALKIKNMIVSDGALREGILYDLIGRTENDDARSESIELFSNRFVLDRKHAERVQRTAQQLFNQARNHWFTDPDNEAEKHLQWAVSLHEVGLCIAHSQYHLHGYYMTNNADLMGFSKQDQSLLALLIKMQRRCPDMSLFDEFGEKNSRMAQGLLILLRLAVLLNRSRSHKAPGITSININKKNVQLIFQSDWLEQHPLSYSDLELETTLLQDTSYTLEFLSESDL